MGEIATYCRRWIVVEIPATLVASKRPQNHPAVVQRPFKPDGTLADQICLFRRSPHCSVSSFPMNKTRLGLNHHGEYIFGDLSVEKRKPAISLKHAARVVANRIAK